MKITVLLALLFSFAAHATPNDDHLSNRAKAVAVAKHLLSPPIHAVRAKGAKISASFMCLEGDCGDEFVFESPAGLLAVNVLYGTTRISMLKGPKPKVTNCGSLASFALHTNAYAYEETNSKTVVPRVADTDSQGKIINIDKKQWKRVNGFYSSLKDYFDPSEPKSPNLEIRAYIGMYIELEKSAGGCTLRKSLDTAGN